MPRFCIFALMKRFVLIGLCFVAVLFMACDPYPRESERMEAALKQADSVYREGENDTALFIPGLEKASSYFADKKQYGKAALAALYNGYAEKDYDKAEAMESFKEAEHFGEIARDSLTMARARYQMGKLLYDEGRKEDALLSFKVSYGHFGNRIIERAFVENSLSVMYIMLNQFDSAEFHLQNSLLDAQKCHSTKLELKAWNNLAVLYQLQGNYDKSIDCLRNALRQDNLDEEETVKILLNLSNTFLVKGEVDSTALYLRRLEEIDSDGKIKNDTKLSAYGALLRFAEKQGDETAALRYREKHENILYDVMKQRQEQSVYRIQKQYDYETLRNTMNKKIIQRHKIILVATFLLLALAIVVLVLQYRHKQLLKDEEEMKLQLDVLKENLRQTVKSSVIDAVIVSRLRTIIVATRTVSRVKDPKHEWRPLLLGVMGGKESSFDAAKMVIESAYPDLHNYILSNYPDLNDTEAKVCLLSCFDLSNAEIAELLGLSTNTVNQTRSSLRKKLDLKSEKMSEQLRDIFAK